LKFLVQFSKPSAAQTPRVEVALAVVADLILTIKSRLCRFKMTNVLWTKSVSVRCSRAYSTCAIWTPSRSGAKLVRQHRPADLLALPDFMRPREPRKAAASASTLAAPVSSGSVVPVKQARTKDFSSATAAKPPEETAKRLICARCDVKISLPEGKYCWNNVKRFDGVTHCREHQALFFLRA